MATNKDALPIFHRWYTKPSQARLAALCSLLFMLSSCQTALSSEQVTTAFWEAMAQGDLEATRKHTTRETQQLVTKQQNLEGATLKTGVVVIDGPQAKVAVNGHLYHLEKARKQPGIIFRYRFIKRKRSMEN